MTASRQAYGDGCMLPLQFEKDEIYSYVECPPYQEDEDNNIILGGDPDA